MPDFAPRAASATLTFISKSLFAVSMKLSTAIIHIDAYNWRHFRFQARESDIFIVTYPRSGTTWLQMIVYQLCSNGDRSFEHISQVAPTFEQQFRQASVPANSQTASARRIFKSHLSYREIPKANCKYIYVMRNGEDVAFSYYKFNCSHGGYRGTFSEYFSLFMKGKGHCGSWFTHTHSWWQHRRDPRVLFLRYEELIERLPETLVKIATFCEVTIDQARFPEILEACSFQYMKSHGQKFDPLGGILIEGRHKASVFIREGRVGEGKEAMNQAQQDAFRSAFQRTYGSAGNQAPP